MKLSNTIQRRVIMEELCRVQTHPTAEDLYQAVHIRLPRISLGTVYRNLNILAEAGLIRKLETAGSQTRFDGNVAPHYHLRCRECGALEDLMLDTEAAGTLESGITSCIGGRVHGCHVEFSGFCTRCAERRQAAGV